MPAGCWNGFFLQILVRCVKGVYICKSFIFVSDSEAGGWRLKWSPVFLGGQQGPTCLLSMSNTGIRLLNNLSLSLSLSLSTSDTKEPLLLAVQPLVVKGCPPVHILYRYLPYH